MPQPQISRYRVFINNANIPNMRTFNPRSFVLSVTIMILFASVGWISSVSALQQQQQQTQLGVRITEPVRGQQLAIGKNLTIAGTSSDSSTSNCGVYVIVNGINHTRRPYRLDKLEEMIILNGNTHLLQHMSVRLKKVLIE
jgi:hypothetical protein